MSELKPLVQSVRRGKDRQQYKRVRMVLAGQTVPKGYIRMKYPVLRDGKLVRVLGFLPLDRPDLQLQAVKLDMAYFRLLADAYPSKSEERKELLRRVAVIKRGLPELVDAVRWQRLCHKLGPGILD